MPSEKLQVILELVTGVYEPRPDEEQIVVREMVRKKLALCVIDNA